MYRLNSPSNIASCKGGSCTFELFFFNLSPRCWRALPIYAMYASIKNSWMAIVGPAQGGSMLLARKRQIR